MSEVAGGAAPTTFRVPRTAYLVVLFLLVGSVPLAFTASGFSFAAGGHAQGAPAALGWQTLVLLIPLIAGLYIARTATVVDAAGIRVRAPFGSRTLAWNDVRGLSVTGRGVYAVIARGSVRLPCVGVAQLATLARASGGRLPELPEYRPKPPPQRRRR